MAGAQHGDFVQGSSSQPYANNHHTYQAPVHNVGQAWNSNSGVNQGIINQFVYHGSAPGLPVCLMPIPDASHTRNPRTCPPNSKCLPGTRKKVLGKLRSWVLDEPFEELEVEQEPNRSYSPLFRREPQPTPIPEDTRIVWLCGPVGCGKSAISQAVADELDERGLLLGCFFFFRGSGDRSRIARLIVTLADQMMARIPATCPLVESALKKPGLQAMSPGNQLKWLIFEPLQRHLRDLEAAGPIDYRPNLAPSFPMVDPTPEPTSRKRPSDSEIPHAKRTRHHSPVNTPAGSSLPPPPPPSLPPMFGPFLFLLDGIDECEDRGEVAELIDDILLLFEQYPNLPLRFLIASRIEEHIRACIQRPEVHIENLRDHHPRHDIMALVRHTFAKAAQQSLVIQSYGKEWPPEDDVDQLIKHADGSFVFITTLLSYILGLEMEDADGLTPMDRFKRALNMNPGLDGLYYQILQRAKHTPHFAQIILTLALLHKPLPIPSLAKLLQIPPFQVMNTLVPLQSIFHVPGDDETLVTVFHTSLRDFILDEERSKEIISLSQQDDVRIYLAYETLKTSVEFAPHMTSKHRWNCPPLQAYAATFVINHWTGLPGLAKQHLDFIFRIAEPHLAMCHFQIALAAYFTSAAFTLHHTLPAVLDNLTGTEHCLGTAKQSYSCHSPVPLLLGAFLEVTANTVWANSDRTPISTAWVDTIRETPPGPDLHRCLAVHLMRCLFPCAVRGILDPLYAIEHWTRHLALGVAADSELHDVALLRFLESPYPCPEWKAPSESWAPVGHGIPTNVQKAVDAIEARFPGLLASSPWAEGGGEWDGDTVKLSRSCEGLSVLHMLRVFCALLQFMDSNPEIDPLVRLDLPGDVTVYFQLRIFEVEPSMKEFSWSTWLETPESRLFPPEE